MDNEWNEIPEETSADQGEAIPNEIVQSQSQSEWNQDNSDQGQYDQSGSDAVIIESKVPQKNNMALASMIMGIVGLVLSCCCMGTVFGVLAVLFACLSKTETKMDSKAKAGLIMGIIGIVLTIVMFIVMVVMGAMDSLDSQFYNMMRAVTQARYLA